MPYRTHHPAAPQSNMLAQKVAQQTDWNIRYFAAHADEIDARIDELDKAWDTHTQAEIERELYALKALRDVSRLETIDLEEEEMARICRRMAEAA